MDDDPDKAAATRVERPARAEADTEPAVIEAIPGKTLDAGRRYELGDEIARGGMGRVLVATDTLLGRTVALKAALASETEAKRRFLRETKITARLEHPAIVPVYDAGKTADGLPYYVMRKVAGRPLESLIRERRAIDDRLALLPNVLAAVDAVAHAHLRGVVHRDLKPANILVGELGETIVIDWGLAKAIEDPDDDVELGDVRGVETGKTLDGSVVGTPGFMAPEQLQGDPVTRSCDVYALGATLYTVLAGQPPHAGRTGDEMIANALSGPPRPLDDVVDGVPDELIAIVDRAMAYDDFRRYADAAELAADLRRFLTGQLVAAHRYSAVERAVRFVRRNRASTVIAVVAMAAMSIGAYVSVTRIIRERNLAAEARDVAQREREAAELARAREAERADDLLLAQATALIPTNPTVAVGLLHQLPAGSKVWPRARDILAEARARGVPWALPASSFTSALALSRDGKAAYSAGSDGVVRAYDLEARTARELHRGSTLLSLASDDRWLVLGGGKQLTWLDVKSGASQTVTFTTEIDQLAAAGEWAIVHAEGKLQLVSHEGAVVGIAAVSKVFAIVASPDGKHVAVNAEPDAMVIEPSGQPKILLTRPSRSMQPAWSADGVRVAFARVGGLDEIDLSASPPATRAIATIPSAVQAAAYVGDDLYFSTAGQTAYRYHPRDGIVAIDVPAALYSSASATRDAALFVNINGLVALAGRGGTLTLQGPDPRLVHATARPTSTRLLAAVRDHVLLYDSAQLLPRSLDLSLSNSTFHGFTGNQHYAIAYMVDDWVQVDLATGATHSLGKLEFGQLVSASPDGGYVIARKQKTPDLVIMRPDQPPAPLLSVTRAVALSGTRAVIADDRSVQALDVATGTRTPLWTSDKPLAGLVGAGTFVAAYAPGTLWRYDDRSHATTTAAPPAASTELPTAVDVAADGTVWFATRTALYKWPLDGAPVQTAKLSRTLARINRVANLGILGVDDKRTAVLFADDAASPAGLPANYELAFLAHDAPLLAGLTHDRKLALYDLSTRYLWRLGTGNTMADISDDGRHIATYNEGQISIYTLDLAADRDAYVKQLDAATNLRVEGRGNDVVWP